MDCALGTGIARASDLSDGSGVDGDLQVPLSSCYPEGDRLGLRCQGESAGKIDALADSKDQAIF
jgi:hypothetical protein